MFRGYDREFTSPPELAETRPAPVVPLAIVGTINSACLMKTMFAMVAQEREITRKAFVEVGGTKGQKILRCLSGAPASDLSMEAVSGHAGANGLILFPGFRSSDSTELHLFSEFTHHVLLRKMGEYKYPSLSQIRAIDHFAQAADMDPKDVGWCFRRTDGGALTRRVEHIATANGFQLSTVIAPLGTTLDQLIFPGK